MIPGTPENKRLLSRPPNPDLDIVYNKSGKAEQSDGPFSVENKMGFSPKLHCVCGASIDAKAGRFAIGRFRLEHEDCLPEQADSDTLAKNPLVRVKNAEQR